MELIINRQDLFTGTDGYYLAHCISSDYALGAGIAVEFQKRFHLKDSLHTIGGGNYPDCILVGRVFNLVTKAEYWNKPTEDSLRVSLSLMKIQVKDAGIKKLAMPKIGCGLDRLSWPRVKGILEEVFADMDVEILVCYL